MHQHPDIITVQKKGPNGTGRGEDIQKAIDKAMSNNRHCVVYVPCGLWKLPEPLRLYPPAHLTPEVLYGNTKQHCIDATEEELLVGLNFSVALRGARPAFEGDGTHGHFTILECEFSDGPAIDIQATRATTIADLALKGRNRGIFDKKLLDEDFLNLDNDDIWVDPGISPQHVAIAIDEHEGTGSSLVLIDNVNARFFAAGITIGTSGHPCTLNSENHLIRRFHGQYLGRAGVRLGHSQTKGITITDSFFFGQQYWIDCVNAGRQKGHPPTLTGCTVGGTQRLFNVHHGYGQFACHGLFVESTLSLGTLGWGSASQNLPAVFTGCQFDLFQQIPRRCLDNPAPTNLTECQQTEKTFEYRAVDTHLLCGRPVLFQGCIFRFNNADNSPAHLRVHNMNQCVFDTCTFAWKSPSGQPLISFQRYTLFKSVPGYDQPLQSPLVSFRNCTYHSGPDGWWTALHGDTPKPPATKLPSAVLRREALSNIIPAYDVPPLEEVVIELDSTLATVDIQPADLIGLHPGNDSTLDDWPPLVHVDAVDNNPSYQPNTILPFAIVDRVDKLASGVQRIYLRQVAYTIYNRLDTPQTWDLRVERPQQLWWEVQAAGGMRQVG